MKKLRKFLSLTPSDYPVWESTVFSYLSLGSLWILVNVVSEVLEQFSFWIGTVFAVAQWLVLRRYIRHLGWWVLVSVWGWMIAFALIFMVGVGDWISAMVPGGELEIGGVPVYMQVFWTSVLVRLLEWAVIGVLQWLVLRRHIQHSSWWVLASSLGGAVKGAVELVISSAVGYVLGAIAGSFGYGVVTDVALVLLLKHHIKHRLERRRRLSVTF